MPRNYPLLTLLVMPQWATRLIHATVNRAGYLYLCGGFKLANDVLSERRDLNFGLRLQRVQTTLNRAPMWHGCKAEFASQTSIFDKKFVQLQTLESAERDGDDREQQEGESRISSWPTSLAFDICF